MPVSKAQQKAVAKYMKSNYDELKIRVEKGKKEVLQSHATTKGESLNGFVKRAIDETLVRDNNCTPQPTDESLE
jgi:predicted HicB family RNase H-like nuclease